ASFPKLPHVRRLGIQVEASAVNRTVPRESIGRIIQEMLSRGWEVFLFGSPRPPLTGLPPGVSDFAGLGFPFRKSVAVMSQCDVLLGPDSALVHVAGAIDLPCVALYGPFPAKLRTAYAPSITAIQGGGPCAPCFHHQRGGVLFPQGKPCTKSRRCEVLAAIDHAKVVKAIEKACRR
ncbi:MAG TPA: glycosyltransferase family 9 protein, partial [Candidatus Synoicihabitans sp.]|nr:glycosyltransferase family 9 protein [Candidatus Synoicihabitans sp.]